MLFLAQTATAGTLQRFLHDFVPFDRLDTLVLDLRLPFLILAALILIIGLFMRAGHEGDLSVLITTVVLALAIGTSPMILRWGEDLVTALVNAIVQRDPSLNWIVVNNPTDMAMAMNFDAPYQKISAWVKGSMNNAPSPSFFNPGATANYVIHCACIFVTSFAATLAVFFMEVMLVLQKLVLVLSRLFAPVFIACLGLPSARQIGCNFFKGLVGVMCWPISWAFVHMGTLIGLGHLAPPVWNAAFGDLIVPIIGFVVACGLMVLGTLVAPVFTTRAVMRGDNPALGFLGAMASAGGQHLTRLTHAVSRLGGAVIGGAAEGKAGVVGGERAGAMFGGMLTAPLSAVTHAAENITESRHPLPSSYSQNLASQAISGLRSRLKA